MATAIRANGSATHVTATRTAKRRGVSARGRGRVLVETVALLIIAALLILAPAISRPRAGEFETGTVLTAPGDTLWTLATEHPVPGVSTAQAVKIIAELNALDGATIPAGKAVEVPVAQSEVEFAQK